MSKKILVVDDDVDVIQVVQTILQTKGYDIVVAHDGQTGLDMVAQHMPDLIILDLMMPVISGLEVCRRVRRDEKTREIPIIIISAAAKQADKPESFFRDGLGADDFITKPFDPLNLLGRVEAVLRMKTYVSNGRPPSESPPKPHSGPPKLKSSASSTGVKLDELPLLDPAGIVKAFVEAWNTQSFAVEHRCLTPSMTGNLPEKSYVMRRQQAHMDDQPLDKTQRVRAVTEMTADDTSAIVVIDREDTIRGHVHARRERYELIRGEHNWQIKMVKPLAD